MAGRQLLPNPFGHSQGWFLLRLEEEKSKLIAAVTGCGVNGPAITLENVSESAESSAADQVSIMVIDRF